MALSKHTMMYTYMCIVHDMSSEDENLNRQVKDEYSAGATLFLGNYAGFIVRVYKVLWGLLTCTDRTLLSGAAVHPTLSLSGSSEP